MPRLIQSIVILLLTFNFDGHAFAADNRIGVSQFYNGEQLLSGLKRHRSHQAHTLARGYIQGVADSFNFCFSTSGSSPRLICSQSFCACSLAAFSEIVG